MCQVAEGVEGDCQHDGGFEDLEDCFFFRECSEVVVICYFCVVRFHSAFDFLEESLKLFCLNLESLFRLFCLRHPRGVTVFIVCRTSSQNGKFFLYL